MYVNQLNITEGGKITNNGAQSAPIANHVDPATATAADIAAKQNEILAALRGVGIIASS